MESNAMDQYASANIDRQASHVNLNDLRRIRQF